MLTLSDSIEINATPQQIEEWLMNVDKHYAEWHPDHVKWVNLDGKLDEGDTFYYEEYLNGRLYKSKCRVTSISRNQRTEIKFKGLPPLDRILGVGGSFIIEPSGDTCAVTATINLRFGWLISRLAKGTIEAIQTHMKEEGESLKKILEG